MLNVEISEVLNTPGKMYEVAEKVNYNRPLTSEETEIAQMGDAWAKEIGKTGCDYEKQVAAFITKTVQDELYNAPDELLDAMFNRGSIGEFDDYQATRTVKNTLEAHEAAKGGNVLRSYLHVENVKPSWHNIQIETDLSYVDLRKNGFKSIANLSTYMAEAAKNKMFAIVFNAVDSAITGGNQVINVLAADPTIAAMDQLALYLNEYGDGSNPFTVSLMKYCSKIRRMTGYAEYLSDAMKDEFNRYGLVRLYDGVAITGISSAHKLGDGSMLLPDKRIFGIGGRIGDLDMKGEVHTYEDMDNQNERIHLMMKDFTFGFSISHIERLAKMTLQ